MKFKTLATISITLILLVTMFGTVFAQDGTDPTTEPTAAPTTEPTAAPTDEPTAEPTIAPTTAPTGEPTAEPTAEPTEVPGSKFFHHPVVQLLSLYFDRNYQEPVTPTDPNAPTPAPTEGEETDSGLGPIGEQIAALHEEGMGFGVLVKIFAIAEAQQTACPGVPPTDDGTGTGESTEPTCTAATADELVAAFKSGGMGALFKQYGKPALLGVGHVRKAVKNMPPAVQPTYAPTAAPAAGTLTNGYPNGNGNGHGNGNGNGHGQKPHTNNGNGWGKNK